MVGGASAPSRRPRSRPLFGGCGRGEKGVPVSSPMKPGFRAGASAGDRGTASAVDSGTAWVRRHGLGSGGGGRRLRGARRPARGPRAARRSARLAASPQRDALRGLAQARPPAAVPGLAVGRSGLDGRVDREPSHAVVPALPVSLAQQGAAAVPQAPGASSRPTLRSSTPAILAVDLERAAERRTPDRRRALTSRCPLWTFPEEGRGSAGRARTAAEGGTARGRALRTAPARSVRRAPGEDGPVRSRAWP